MTKSTNLRPIVFTGGGSGGHLNVCEAVLRDWQGRQPELFARVVFIGGLHGMQGDSEGSLESKRIPELGVPFIGIRSGKLNRFFSWRNLKVAAGSLAGLVDAWRTLRRLRPAFVFSSGGYVTVPVVLAAWTLRIPVAIHEQTTVAGLANRISSKFAQRIFLSFPESVQYFPAARSVVTGNPVQATRLQTDLPTGLAPDYARFLSNLAQRPADSQFLFVTGGGLGSHIINQWVLANLDHLSNQYYLLVQTGSHQQFRDSDALRAARASLSAAQQERVWIVERYSAEIGYIFAQADLVIARAGVNTLLELLAVEKRAVFIPIPWSSHNEQQSNAEYFCKLQTGAIVPQAEIDSQLLPAIASTLAKPVQDSKDKIILDATARISAELEKLIPQS